MKPSCRVVIVDDSTVFRSQLRAAVDGVSNIEVVGFASNGQLAIEILKNKQPDVLVLDLEMPVMNGIETMKEMKKLGLQTKIIVFSAHTKSGAITTMEAFSLGASDLLTKPQADSPDQNPAELIRAQLVPKILQFGKAEAGTKPVGTPALLVPRPDQTTGPYPTLNFNSFMPAAIVIASSTGGPAALELLFDLLRPPLTVPIFIAQHMPPVFTSALAERLSAKSDIVVAEGKHGEPAKPGRVYIAPGDFHMRLVSVKGVATITLDQESPRNSVRPAADYLFESANTIYKNRLLGIVLTGMGADGKDGAVAIKKSGGGVVIQNKESCVVFGMPGAVHECKAYDKAASIPEIASILQKLGVTRNVQSAG